MLSRVDDAEVDALYAGPLTGFVAARKALAKRLRDAGDKEGARAVDGLAKPSLPAWALNQLVRAHRDLLARFLAAIDRQRDLQLAALDGSVNAEALRDAKQAETAAAAALLERLPALLDAGGHAAGKATVDRVQRALRAAALNPDARVLLERGRLVDEQASAGFDAVAAQLDPAVLMAALRGSPAAPRPSKRKVDGFFARAARAQSAGAPAGEASKPQRDDDAARERERLERDRAERLSRARLTVAEARAELELLREQSETQAARVRELTEALEAATAEARHTQRRIGQLKERLAKAEKRVRILGD